MALIKSQLKEVQAAVEAGLRDKLLEDFEEKAKDMAQKSKPLEDSLHELIKTLSVNRNDITVSTEIPKFQGGQGQNAEEWLKVFSAISKSMGWDNSRKMTQLVTALEEGARTWFFSQPSAVQNEFESFEAAFQKKYVHGDRAQVLQKLNHVRQENGMSVEVYTNLMGGLLKRSGLDDAAQVVFYTGGLKNDIKEEVLLAEPASMKEAVKRAKAVERVKQQCRPINGSKVNFTSMPFETDVPHNFSGAMEMPASMIASYQYPSMLPYPEVYQTQMQNHGSQNTRRPRLTQRAPQVCYNCRQPGHRVAECSEPKRCYRCEQEDHVQKDCPLNSRGPAERRGPPRRY